MKKQLVLGFSVILLASIGSLSSASAQEKTRAEVRQELVQAENDGSALVSDASYPDLSPSLALAIKSKRSDTSGFGPDTSGSASAGSNVTKSKSKDRLTAKPTCVGPVGFCTPYFGD